LVTRVVHFVPRAKSLSFAQRARMLAELNVPEHEDEWTRVVEMFNPSMDALVYDLAFDATHTPEVQTVLRHANAVHVHGLALDLALRMLPFIPPEAIAGVPLYLHGPVARGDEEARPDPTRLDKWPGPVICDQRVDALTIEKIGEKAQLERCVAPVWLDPNDPTLLPRTTGPRPFYRMNANGERELVARICASPHCPAAHLESIKLRLAVDGLIIEWVPENAQDPSKTRALRRTACAALVVGKSDPWLEETLLQGVPTLIVRWPDLQEAEIDDPPGVHWVDGVEAEDAFAKAGDHLIQWASHWSSGNATPVDTREAHDFMVQRSYATVRRSNVETWPILPRTC
jgi:hypothetical protein